MTLFVYLTSKIRSIDYKNSAQEITNAADLPTP